MKTSTLLVALLSLPVVLPAPAETVKDRKGAVLNDKANLENDPRWIYNDIDKGFAEGSRTGKPVLVVLRCVPCLACAGIDAKVLLEDAELTPLLDQFVCVRVINANALDLSRFQFDFDLSFSTLIFNGDGTLYGRYGSWTHQKNPREETTAGFRASLEAALALHQGYPANKDQLAGKQGKPSPYATPVDMPTLNGKYNRSLDWDGEVLKSCVHCHQIGDALRVAHRERKEAIPANLIYPFPGPETLGLELAQDSIARIASVAADSAAKAAGLRAGDELVRLNGQPLISSADVSWVLHHAPATGSLAAELRRGGQMMSVAVPLAEDWRRQSDISRRVGTWPMRAMALGGMFLEDLSDESRSERGLGTDGLALFAKHVGQYGEHAAAKKAGFQKDDVIVALDGITRRTSESELIGYLLTKRQPGERVKATVLRDGQRLEFSFPMQ
ncbi:MAG TPA: peptidase [Verrucomicrobiales bacterium]|nr:peptidase [Verrucomicrobiales bacterium]